MVRTPCLRPLLFHWSLNSKLCKAASWIKGQRLGEKRVKQTETMHTCKFCLSLVLMCCGACSEASRSWSYFKKIPVMKLRVTTTSSATLSLGYILVMIFLADCTYFFILKSYILTIKKLIFHHPCKKKKVANYFQRNVLG